MALIIDKMKHSCDEVAALLRSLAHPGRLMIMGHLIEGERTVTELEQLCELSQSQLSQFLSRMKTEKLVDSRKEGRFQYYFATDKRVLSLIRSIQKIYCS